MSSFRVRKGGKGFYIDFVIPGKPKVQKVYNVLQTLFSEEHFQFDGLAEMRDRKARQFHKTVHEFISPDQPELKAQLIFAKNNLDVSVLKDLETSGLPITTTNIKTVYEDTYLVKKKVVGERRVVTNKIKEVKLKSVLNLIDDYTKEYKLTIAVKKRILLLHSYFGDDINSVSFRELREYYNTYLVYEIPHSNHKAKKGYAGHFVRNIYRLHKGFINYLINDGVCTNRQWLTVKIEADTGNESTVGLDLNSLSILELAYLDNEFKDSPRMKENLEYMLIGIYTGARNSDLQNLSRDNFTKEDSGYWVCEYTSIKSGNTVSIPLDGIIDRIIEERSKTEGKWFNEPRFDSPNLKKGFSEILVRKGITHQIKCKRRIMFEGKRKMKKVDRYIHEEFKGHGLRVTFCTMLKLREGMDVHEIATMSGHLNVQQVSTYLDSGVMTKFAHKKLKESYARREELKNNNLTIVK